MTQALINALLADKADFNWVTHTWSHQFLGCNVWQPQPLTSVTASSTGGSFTAGAYTYEITAATAYGESEPSLPKPVSVSSGGSVTLTWPDAANGTNTDGTIPGPSLAQEEAIHSGGTSFWGYYIYRATGGSTNYGLVGQVPENGDDAHLQLHRHRGDRTGRRSRSHRRLPDRHQPWHRLCSELGRSRGPPSWEPATSTSDRLLHRAGDRPRRRLRRRQQPAELQPSVVVTGEHSGVENPNMPAALQGAGVTAFAADASRQPQQYNLGARGVGPPLPEQHLLQRLELGRRAERVQHAVRRPRGFDRRQRIPL